VKAPTERRCMNQRPSEVGPCLRPWDGHDGGGGCIDACAECRTVCNAVGLAAVALLVERAAEIEAADKAA
jgi:hypothetical protein